MSERVSIESSPDGTSLVIRIRVSAARRVFDAIKTTLIAAGVLLLASLIRPDRWTEPGVYLAIMGGGCVAVGLLSLLRAGETVHVTAGEVRVHSPLESYSVSRDEQAAPIYSALPSRWLFAQRTGSERGSGVLLFGSHERGLRFGVDLDAAQAHQVVGAFTLPSTPRPSGVVSAGIARPVFRALVWLTFLFVLVAFVMFSDADLRPPAVFAIAGGVALVLLLANDAVDRRFPQRVKLS